MANDYKKYLAEKVLGDQEIVTYRSLSRALKVHANLAKRMLYEFHRSENSKKPQSVNATYLITGIQISKEKHTPNGSHKKDGEDEVMQSSPFMSSQAERQYEPKYTPEVLSVILAREDELPDARSQFRKVFSIFVYSLQSTRLQDLNVLSDVGYDTLVSQPEDPLEHGKQYGTIQNKDVRRRSGLPPAPPPPMEPVKKPKVTKTEPESKSSKTEFASQDSETKATQQSTPKTSTPSTPSESQTSSKQATKPSTLKRDNSNIFKAFAKAKGKPKRENTTSSTGSHMDSGEPSGNEEVFPDDDSEEEREDLFLDTGTKSSSKARESRKEREEKLRKMMEDEEMEDAPELPPQDEDAASAESTPAEDVSQPATEAEPEHEQAPTAPAAKGRRRGRRQVMKKRTTKDDDGYIVTKEEPVWESFSEDEVEPPKRKPAVSAAAKSGKGNNKPGGQGSIMSFFGKK